MSIDNRTENVVPIESKPADLAPVPSYRGISEKPKIVVLLLCIFLGVFGVHRFYVGKTGTAVVFLFTGGVFLVGWVTDIFNICIGNFSDQIGHFIQK